MFLSREERRTRVGSKSVVRCVIESLAEFCEDLCLEVLFCVVFCCVQVLDSTIFLGEV